MNLPTEPDVLARDLAQHKEAEEAMRAIEQRVSAILRNVADSVVTIDEAGVILSANQAFATTFGYSVDEVIGKDITVIMPEPYRSAHTGYMGQYFESGISQIIGTSGRELEAVDKEGRVFPIELTIGEAMIDGQRIFIGSMRDISDRKKADEKSRESAQILNQMQESVIATDLEGIITTWTGGSELIYGYSADEAIGKHISLVFPEEDREALERNIFSQFEHTHFFHTEGPRRRKSGEIFYSHASASVLRDSLGEIAGFVGMGYDMSERKRAEDALRESEERYRSIVTALSEGVIFQNARGQIIDWNNRATEILGVSNEQLRDVIPVDLGWKFVKEDGVTPFPGDDHPSMVTLRTGMPCADVVLGISHPERGLYWIQINSEPLFEVGVAKPFGVVSSFSDITQRRQSEEALHRSEERYALAARYGRTAAWEIFPEEGKIYTDKNLMALLGMPDTPPPSNVDALMDTLHEEDRDVVAQAMGDVFEGRTTHFSVDHRTRRADGSYGWHRDEGYMASKPGEPLRVVGTTTDITSQKEAEQKLQQAQKMEAVGQLTGGIAHDFNNLLMVILGNLELALDGLPANNDLRPILSEGLQASERGAALTRQLLAFSRRQTLMPKPTDINRLTGHMLGLARRTLGEAVEIVFEADENLWEADIDAAQLENALLNLAINARDAMPDGGTLTIRTHNLSSAEAAFEVPDALGAGDYVVVAVEDTGTGMSADIREKAFEPFFTTKEAGRGSGLGLSMVYGLVKQSGGHIDIDSSPGKGTTIRLYLPRSLKTSEAAREKQTILIESKSLGETVLIVEDDPHVRKLAVSLVEALGYTALQTGEAESALEIVGNGDHVDLVLSDVVLGKNMNGVELANRVRESWPNTKVLLMSGYAPEEFTQAGGLGDTYELIGKPFRKADLAHKIDSLLH